MDEVQGRHPLDERDKDERESLQLLRFYRLEPNGNNHEVHRDEIKEGDRIIMIGIQYGRLYLCDSVIHTENLPGFPGTGYSLLQAYRTDSWKPTDWKPTDRDTTAPVQNMEHQ